jgi:hypothetical protein
MQCPINSKDAKSLIEFNHFRQPVHNSMPLKKNQEYAKAYNEQFGQRSRDSRKPYTRIIDAAGGQALQNHD